MARQINFSMPSTSMKIDYTKTNPEAFQAMMTFSNYANTTKLDKKLIDLVKIRASQMNRCAYCLDMHTAEARKAGESERRLHVVAAWKESGMFNEQERAALRLTEALTELSVTALPDDIREEARANFNDKDFMDLAMVINIINCWNRVTAAGEVEPPK